MRFRLPSIAHGCQSLLVIASKSIRLPERLVESVVFKCAPLGVETDSACARLALKCFDEFVETGKPSQTMRLARQAFQELEKGVIRQT